MKFRRVTLSEIAKAAKVSTSTVSRALNNDPRISNSTKERIQVLCKEMGYFPTVVPNIKYSNRNKIIGLLISDLSAFYTNLYKSIQQTAEEMGYWVLQACTEDDDDRTLSLIDSMIGSDVRGIIFGSCKLDDPLVEGLIEDDFPVVLVNRRMKAHKCDSIYVDNEYGAYLVISHLINIGFQRISIITASLKFSVSADRYKGYLRALEERGLPIDNKMIRHGLIFSRGTGYQQTRRLLLSESPPDAIFCCDEKLALGCMLALKDMNKRVPEDVAVCGFDDADTDLMRYLQMTTVGHDVKEMGRQAARAIIGRVEGNAKPLIETKLVPNLIIRKSCGLEFSSRRESAYLPYV